MMGSILVWIPGEKMALACSVIPMGWHNSVGIMQEISENLLLFHLSIKWCEGNHCHAGFRIF